MNKPDKDMIELDKRMTAIQKAVAKAFGPDWKPEPHVYDSDSDGGWLIWCASWEHRTGIMLTEQGLGLVAAARYPREYLDRLQGNNRLPEGRFPFYRNAAPGMIAENLQVNFLPAFLKKRAELRLRLQPFLDKKDAMREAMDALAKTLQYPSVDSPQRLLLGCSPEFTVSRDACVRVFGYDPAKGKISMEIHGLPVDVAQAVAKLLNEKLPDPVWPSEGKG